MANTKEALWDAADKHVLHVPHAFFVEVTLLSNSLLLPTLVWNSRFRYQSCTQWMALNDQKMLERRAISTFYTVGKYANNGVTVCIIGKGDPWSSGPGTTCIKSLVLKVFWLFFIWSVSLRSNLATANLRGAAPMSVGGHPYLKFPKRQMRWWDRRSEINRWTYFQRLLGRSFSMQSQQMHIVAVFLSRWPNSFSTFAWKLEEVWELLDVSKANFLTFLQSYKDQSADHFSAVAIGRLTSQVVVAGHPRLLLRRFKDFDQAKQTRDKTRVWNFLFLPGTTNICSFVSPSIIHYFVSKVAAKQAFRKSLGNTHFCLTCCWLVEVLLLQTEASRLQRPSLSLMESRAMESSVWTSWLPQTQPSDVSLGRIYIYWCFHSPGVTVQQEFEDTHHLPTHFRKSVPQERVQRMGYKEFQGEETSGFCSRHQVMDKNRS